MLVILAGMGAAAGEIVHSLFGLPKLVGSLAMIAATGAMLVFNSAVIEKFLTVSVGYLYLVYFVFVVWSVVAFGDRIEANFASVPVGEDWFTAGVTYAGYNRSEEHTSELQSLMRISYAVFCLKKKKKHSTIRIASIL